MGTAPISFRYRKLSQYLYCKTFLHIKDKIGIGIGKKNQTDSENRPLLIQHYDEMDESLFSRAAFPSGATYLVTMVSVGMDVWMYTWLLTSDTKFRKCHQISKIPKQEYISDHSEQLLDPPNHHPLPQVKGI